MSQPHSKPPRGLKTPNAPQLPTTKASPVACSVQQAIQRDPLQALPGDEAAHRQHPVMQAIDLLINYDVNECWEDRDDEQRAYHEAGRNLQEYHAEQMAAIQHASGNAEEAKRQLSEIIEDVAEMMGFDLTDRTAGDMLEALRDRLNPPAPIIEPALSDAAEKAGAHLHDVCTVLAKHFGDDPAVTFENAPGLVSSVVDSLEDLRSLSQYHAGTSNDLREECEKLRATLQQDSQKSRDTIDADAVRQLVSEFGGGLVSSPVEVFQALREILTNLQKNQQPEGWAANTQILIETNKRYEAVLATMRNVMNLV